MKRILFLSCFLLFTGVTALAQGPLAAGDLKNIDVEKVSDEDIRSYFEKAKASGLSEPQLMDLAKQRGMPDAQIQKLRDRLLLLGLGGSSVSSASAMASKEQPVSEEALRSFDEKLGVIDMKPQLYNKRIFGSELFGELSTTFEPNLRIATPSNYIIGPDDELIINVYGYSEKTYRQRVSAEGNIYIENVGPVFVNGLSVEEAEARIKAKLSSTIYRAMASGATKMQLRLGNIRSMRITIIGEAKKPGTYTVSSLTTLFNALYLCGGPTDFGSFRNIELIRGNKVIRTVDLYRFLAKGDRSDNVLLQEQDVIRIPYYESRMVFSGYVKRPGIYEIKPGESFEMLFGYAGRFADSAYRKSVTVYKIDDERLAIKTLPADSFAHYVPAMADSVVVGTATMRYANRVNIKGAVMRPGDYELLPGMELKQLIEKAGGLREDAFLGAGNILRIGDNLGPENVSFNPAKVKAGEEKITLKREDEVVIASMLDITDNYFISIEGEVLKPGQFSWRKDLRLRDLILLSGGLSEAAKGGDVHIEISRRIRSADVKGTDFKQSEIIKIASMPGLSDSQSMIILEPFDMVVVRPQPGYQQQKGVFVNGPVMYPGRYFLEKSGERITDLLKRAGGFKASADSHSVFIRRFLKTEIEAEERSSLIAKLSRIPSDSLMNNPLLMEEIKKKYTSLSVNLKKAFENPGGNDDLILEPGDIILVSQNSNLVKVAGEVYFPTLIPYEKGTNIKYYIKRTGDYTSMARRNQTFVIYPDGNAAGVKKFLFFKSYPKVTPRSEIFVPSKGDKGKQGLSTGEWVAISSILATITTLIVSVINAN
ncbi:MAG: SLBB domain-containing protein [Chitinophagaceae bacterium]|nr:SLBB domain-containing protein [Chitinophagaceae bacterium]